MRAQSGSTYRAPITAASANAQSTGFRSVEPPSRAVTNTKATAPGCECRIRAPGRRSGRTSAIALSAAAAHAAAPSSLTAAAARTSTTAAATLAAATTGPAPAATTLAAAARPTATTWTTAAATTRAAAARPTATTRTTTATATLAAALATATTRTTAAAATTLAAALTAPTAHAAALTAGLRFEAALRGALFLRHPFHGALVFTLRGVRVPVPVRHCDLPPRVYFRCRSRSPNATPDHFHSTSTGRARPCSSPLRPLPNRRAERAGIAAFMLGIGVSDVRMSGRHTPPA